VLRPLPHSTIRVLPRCSDLAAHDDEPGRAHRRGAPGQIVSLVEERPENLPCVQILTVARIIGERVHAAPSRLEEFPPNFVAPILDIQDGQQVLPSLWPGLIPIPAMVRYWRCIAVRQLHESR
jgi:hypothetical protein